MEMPKRLVLHIGSPKTGTTSLQSWLYANRTPLGQAGVYLPLSIGQPNNRCLAAAFDPGRDLSDAILQSFMSNHSLDQDDFDSVRQKILSGFGFEISGVQHDLVVVTSEHLHRLVCSEESVRQLHEFLIQFFDDIQVICWFREQYAMCRSRYFTALKMGQARTFDDFLGSCAQGQHPYDHWRSARMWSSIFGFENFSAYLFPPSSSSSLHADFLLAAGIQNITPEMMQTVQPRNQSFGLLGFMLLRELNLALQDQELFSLPEKRKLRQFVLKHPMSSHGTLHSEDHALRIYEEFSASNTRFGQEYLGLPGNPFALENARTPSSMSVPFEEIATGFVGALLAMKK